jgi:hypothetical protein
MTNPGLRASDADRQRVVAALEEHAAAGRLTLDEFGLRVDRVLAARTHGDLTVITVDLPAAGPGPDERRHLLLAFALAALVVAGLAIVLAVAR